MMLIMRVERIKGKIPSIDKLSKILLASQRPKALMKINPNPKVKIIKGKKRNLRIGLKIRLKIVKNRAISAKQKRLPEKSKPLIK